MLETVCRVFHVNQAGANQSFQRPIESGRRCLNCRGQKLAVEDPTDGRRYLRDFLGLAEPVEATHQGILKRGRDVVGRSILRKSRFRNSFGQFLDKQRDAA